MQNFHSNQRLFTKNIILTRWESQPLYFPSLKSNWTAAWWAVFTSRCGLFPCSSMTNYRDMVWSWFLLRWIYSWELNMHSKEELMQGKKAIMRLNKTNRLASRNFRMDQINNLVHSLTRRNSRVSSGSPKDLEDHRRWLKWMITWSNSFLGEKKKPFTTPSQIKNTLEEEGLIVVKGDNPEMPPCT